MRLAACTAALVVLAWAPVAYADSLYEGFDLPDPAWETGWFGANTDAANWYCGGARGCVDTITPSYIYLVGPSGGSATPFEVAFNSGFGSTVLSLRLELSPGTPGVDMQIFDMSSSLIYSVALPTGDWQFYDISTATGVSKVSFTGNAAGNVSLASIAAITSAVPELPVSALLLVGALGLFIRRAIIS
jgi:hypothetical protein